MRTLTTSFRTVEDVQTYLRGLGIDGVSARVAYWLKGRPSFAARFAESVLQKDPLEDEISEVDLGDSVTRTRLSWDLDEYILNFIYSGWSIRLAGTMLQSQDLSGFICPQNEMLQISGCDLNVLYFCRCISQDSIDTKTTAICSCSSVE
jgi:hypothetical protein